MPWYKKADDSVESLIDEVMEKWHQELVAAELEVDCLLAFPNVDDNGESKAPAISLHGRKCYATIKQLGLKDRVAGRGDVELLIDGVDWKKFSIKKKRALLDHELFHLELRLDKQTEEVLRDDIGRPLFKMRKHDVEIGWFDEIAKRHGEYSIEATQAKEFFGGSRHQLYFPFAGSVPYS